MKLSFLLDSVSATGARKFSIRRAYIFALTSFLLGLAHPIHAQELSVLRGEGTNFEGHTTFAEQIEYTQPLNDHFGLNYSYVNEGHFAGHHRDGDAFMFEARTKVLPRLTLSLAAGPIFYYDTVASTRDEHGLGTMAKLDAIWDTGTPWFLVLETNAVKAGTFNTAAVLGGFGYRFDSSKTERGNAGTDTDESVAAKTSELTFMAGRSIVNITGNGQALAESLEYRRELKPWLEWSVAAIDEGKNALTDRAGVAGELWVKKAVLNSRLTLGIGAGVYENKDWKGSADHTAGQLNTAGLFSMTASYQLRSNWDVRLTWHRVITDYNRDSDIAIIGAGYRF